MPLFSEQENMREGIEKLKGVHADMGRIKVEDKKDLVFNTDLIEAIEKKFDDTSNSNYCFAAEARPESRGAHARDDYKERNDAEWMKHTISFYNSETGEVTLKYRPVSFKVFPPAKRVY